MCFLHSAFDLRFDPEYRQIRIVYQFGDPAGLYRGSFRYVILVFGIIGLDGDPMLQKETWYTSDQFKPVWKSPGFQH